MSVSNPTEFTSVDGFYQPEDAGLFFSLGPAMTLAGLLLLVAALMLGWWLGTRRRPTEDASETIYAAIKKAVGEATGASRDNVLSTARRLKAVLDERLGAVLTLAGGLSGPYADLGKALEGVGDPHHPPKGKDDKDEKAGRNVIEKLVINAKHLVLNTGQDRADEDADHEADHHGHGHDDHGGHGHDDHGHGDHGHGKPLDHKTQVARVRAAVHAFSDHWTDKPARLRELRAARRQLTGEAGGSGSGSSDRVWNRR